MRIRAHAPLGILIAAAGAAALAPPPARAATTPPHVMVIVEENREYGDVIGSSSAPYVNGLAQQFGLATQAYAITHPSLPNYLELIAGTTFGITSDCTSCSVEGTTLADQLQAAGYDWRAYMEGMPSPCYTGDTSVDGYAKRHDPFMYFPHIAGNPSECGRVVPYSAIGADLAAGASGPPFMFVAPNVCNDGHDCSTATMDAWLSSNLPAILASPWYQDNGTVLLTWDEGTTSAGCCDGAAGGHIATVVISNAVTGGQRLAGTLDHAGTLRSIEDIYGLAPLGDAACGCSGFLALPGAAPPPPPPPPSHCPAGVGPPQRGGWYRLAASDGGIFDYGAAPYCGSLAGFPLAQPVTGMASRGDGLGYWLVARDGGVFAFGDAGFSGSLGGVRLNAPIAGMAATPDGGGYWLVARDGGVFTFGDAGFRGSMGGVRLNAPVVGMAATPDGAGYWLVASDGGIFCFGDAGFHGSTGGAHLNAPATGMAATPDGSGYWLVASDGGVFSFGGAAFHGSMGGIHLNAPVVGMAATPGGGYWLASSDGGVFSFGDAAFLGSAGSLRLAAPVVAMSS